MITAVQEISNLIEPMAGAARAEASQLGHKVMAGTRCGLLRAGGRADWDWVQGVQASLCPLERGPRAGLCWVGWLGHAGLISLPQVSQMAQYFEPLTLAAIGAASKTPNHQQQMNLLDQTKTLAESALQLLYTAKEAGGNPKVGGCGGFQRLDRAGQGQHQAGCAHQGCAWG